MCLYIFFEASFYIHISLRVLVNNWVNKYMIILFFIFKMLGYNNYPSPLSNLCFRKRLVILGSNSSLLCSYLEQYPPKSQSCIRPRNFTSAALIL